ncbi:uncharacterized protein LOC118744048 [Rhagoletis pomonella]|uniref:uncharacterized protein LOC118744048 n=1 Tax=Rhagoletis pomonella TaxID=28610 RepID=UPI0017816FAC|nr:uncharacterized protein LOC118744048 [Rhagoletis pomonella]
MDADSDEANETTYFEDRRKRSVESDESAELSNAAVVNSEQSKEDITRESTDELFEDANESSEATEPLTQLKRRRDTTSSSKKSDEKHDKDGEKSEDCGCGKSKRAADESNESKSNEDSKQNEKKSAACGCGGAEGANGEEAEKP